MGVEFFNGIPISIRPNTVYMLKDENCYVSYLPYTPDYGSDTTALVRADGVRPEKFLILNGNHVREFLELATYDACVEYFKNHADLKNKNSESWDKEIVIDKNGRITYQPVKNQESVSEPTGS